MKHPVIMVQTEQIFTLQMSKLIGRLDHFTAAERQKKEIIVDLNSSSLLVAPTVLS